MFVGGTRFHRDRLRQEKSKYERPKPKNFVATYGSAVLSLFGSLVSYHLCAKYLGDIGFAEFATSKRLLALVYPIFTQVLAVSLAFHIAKCSEDNLDESPRAYLFAAITFLFAAMFIIWSPVQFWPEATAEVLLGSSTFSGLIKPLPLVLFGTGLVAIASSYWLSRLKFFYSSALTGTASGIVPVLALLAPNNVSADVFWKLGGGLVILGATSCFWVYLDCAPKRPSIQTFQYHFTALWSYAGPRIPGSILLTLVATLPVILAAHGSDTLVSTGVLALGCTLVVLSQSMVQPIAWVLLPYTSRAGVKSENYDVRKTARHSLIGLTVFLVPCILLACYFADMILETWIGQGTQKYAYILQWTLPAILPFSYFECLKSILDGSSRTAYTTVISSLAALSFLVSYKVFQNFHFEVPALPSLQVAGLTLGVGAVFFTYRVLNTNYPKQEPSV